VNSLHHCSPDEELHSLKRMLLGPHRAKQVGQSGVATGYQQLGRMVNKSSSSALQGEPNLRWHLSGQQPNWWELVDFHWLTS